MATNEIIDLISDDETPTPPRPVSNVPTSPSTPTLKRPRGSRSDEELVIVSHTKRSKDAHLRQKKEERLSPSYPKKLGTPTKKSNAVSEGVECVAERRGIQALADYPHFRFQCALEPFKRQRAPKKEKFCKRCFCYVCDVPAGECKVWSLHYKAVDTVTKWRAEREARLEERRRREQCQNPAKRATVVSRVSAPVRVVEVLDDTDSFENGDWGDVLDGRGEPISGEEDEDLCEFDQTIERMDQIALETDCFKMYSLEEELDQAAIARECRRQQAPVSMEGLIP